MFVKLEQEGRSRPQGRARRLLTRPDSCVSPTPAGLDGPGGGPGAAPPAAFSPQHRRMRAPRWKRSVGSGRGQKPTAAKWEWGTPERRERAGQ